MKQLFTLLITFFILQVGFSQTVFKEDFTTNKKHWRLRNDQVNKTQLKEGELHWKRSGQRSDVSTQYINRLDVNRDFTVSAQMRPKAIGSAYGLVWGARDKGNAYYFLVRGTKFRTFRAFDGKVVASKDYKFNFKVSLKDNKLAIKKTASQISYYVNDVKVASEPYQGIDGKGFGFILWQNSSMAIDNFLITGTSLKINLINGLEYTEKPVNLGIGVNSAFDEMTPIITADGTKLYFSRKKHPSNVGGPTDLEDAYYSDNVDGVWQKAKNVGKPINNHGPNAVHAVSPDGNTLVLMNLYETDGKQKGQGLSRSHKTKTGWSVPEQFKIRQYYNKSGFNEFFLSSNNKTLIMAIERKGTNGGRDLYVSFNEGNGIWSQPKNMGRTLNTEGIEMSPFLAPDGVTLYFSSTGHPGYGQNDIFISRRLDNSWKNWSKPQNVGKPINGEGVDAYYSVPASGEFAYFVSTGSGKTTTDIYKVKLPEKVKPKPVVIIKGIVRNSKTNRPIGTNITYRNLKSDKEAGIANSDPVTGAYEIVLPLDQVYAFFAEKKNFYSVRDNIDLTNVGKYQVITRDLYLTPMEIGQSAQLHNVLFVRSKAILLPGSFSELNKLAKVMLANLQMNIQVSGHTDNTGNPDLNKKLSRERAQAVKAYLVKRGVKEMRISTIGHGGDKPIADNSYEASRKKNRRVEFEIMGY